MHSPDPADKSRRPDPTPLPPGPVGGLIAFVFALLWVIFGFWKLLFIIILTLIGYFVGYRYFRDRDSIRKLIDKILPPGMFR